MRYILSLAIFIISFKSFTQDDKGRSFFVGVNVGTKIANKNYALRYSGAYSYLGTNQTELEFALNRPNTYNAIRDLLGGIDFIVPFDAYSTNIRYTPGLLTGVTLGYQINPNLQITADGNFNRLKVQDFFTIQVLDGSVQVSEAQLQLGEIFAEESRFDGRFNFDYVADGDRFKFIIGGSLLYSFWRIDEHFAVFRGLPIQLFSQFSGIPSSDINVTRGQGSGIGLNLGTEYRINEKIVSQIMYQPYHSFVNYGFNINKRIILQHDIGIRFFWK